jgi:hypothetical protein
MNNLPVPSSVHDSYRDSVCTAVEYGLTARDAEVPHQVYPAPEAASGDRQTGSAFLMQVPELSLIEVLARPSEVAVDLTLDLDRCLQMVDEFAVEDVASLEGGEGGRVGRGGGSERSLCTTPPYTRLSELSDEYAEIADWLLDVLGRAAGVQRPRVDRAVSERWGGQGAFEAKLANSESVVFSARVEPTGIARAVFANGGSIEAVQTATAWDSPTQHPNGQ